jgi:hypothetical protein
LQIFSTVGFGDIDINITSEYILACVGMLIGAVCYSFLTSIAISWMNLKLSDSLRLGKHLEIMDSFYKRIEIPKPLQNRVE